MSSRHDVRRGSGTTSAGGLVDDGEYGPCRSNARANPTQVESTELLPPCLRTMYRQSAVRELPRRDLHETESPPWCGARAAVASLPDCGHGPGRSRSGLAPFFFFSRVRRGPTRGLEAKTDRVSTRSSARRPHSVRTPTTIRSSHRGWLTAVPQAVCCTSAAARVALRRCRWLGRGAEAAPRCCTPSRGVAT